MKFNVIYLIVGIFIILSAFTHTWNGIENSLNILNNAEIDSGTKTVFTYIWHIIGIENLIIGISLVIIAFLRNRENLKFTVWVIMVILIARLLIISIFTYMNSESRIFDILIDSIAMVVIVVLLFFGTKLKSKKLVLSKK